MPRRRRPTRLLVPLLLSGLAAATLGPAPASAGGRHHATPAFRRVAAFPVAENSDDPAEEVVAEIVAATDDGRTLLYTDGPNGRIGFVDITDPARPRPAGTVDVGGEPTSVDVAGHHALVATDTSGSASDPSGELVVLALRDRSVVRRIPLAGQPDSIDVGPERRWAAVVVENQRDEDVVVDGVEGGLPQTPPGSLQVVDLVGRPDRWRVRDVPLTGLADVAPDDPEPEFVDVARGGRAVVTLQENNHLVFVDLARGRVTGDASAGTVDLLGVDTVEDGVIDLTGSLDDVPREPDGVTWLSGGRVATANEGDLAGGSRGFTVFDRRGRVRYDSGAAFEEVAARHGHYPEDRSENKGTEPEAVESARFGHDELLFVGSERGSFVAVYEVGRRGDPRFLQLLPTGLSPEGVLAVPERDLLVVSSEVDDPPSGVRATISIYERSRAGATYPDVVSADGPDGRPLGWSALSGLAADPHDPTTLRAVWDSYYDESRIFTIDVGATPAVVRSAVTITGGSGGYDPEGLAHAPDGTSWIASEGDASGSRPNLLVQVDAAGAVLAEVGLPPAVEACRAASANRGTLGSGFEGVAVAPTADGGYELLVAQQRGWDYTTPGCEDLDDDPTGDDPAEPGWTRVWRYDPGTGAWGSVPYELEPVPARASWVGLSEITPLPDGAFAVIERDNRTGAYGELKTVARVTLDGPVSRADKAVFDLLPALRATNGWISDKPEGFAVASDGRAYVVTDNDGVEDWSGETQLLRLGAVGELFE